jgi:hypothetical protein
MVLRPHFLINIRKSVFEFGNYKHVTPDGVASCFPLETQKTAADEAIRAPTESKLSSSECSNLFDDFQWAHADNYLPNLLISPLRRAAERNRVSKARTSVMLNSPMAFNGPTKKSLAQSNGSVNLLAWQTA